MVLTGTITYGRTDMAMKRCPICGERYSDTYKNCPFCEEEEYWEDEQQEPARRPILREGIRSPGGRGGRSAYSIVTPILIVLIVLMALLLVYLLYGDKLFNKDGKTPPDDNRPGVSTPAEPPVTPDKTPATDPDETEEPDDTGEPSGTDTPGEDATGTGTMPEGNAGSSGTDSGGSSGTASGGSSGGMSYASAAALPGGLTLNSTDFSRKPSEGAWKLRVSGGTGTYTWISENPAIATVASDGTVTPVARGITNVLVTDGAKKAVCIVRVTGDPVTSSGGGSTPTTTPSTPTTNTPSSGGGALKAGKAVVVNSGNGVRVRSGPGTSYDILATVPNGGSVQVVRATGTDDWYEITFTAVGGVTTTGYMKGEFLANG